MWGRALMILATLLVPLSARADGGLARLVVDSGEFRLTVFSSPTPLRAGPVDLSVMVQDRETLSGSHPDHAIAGGHDVVHDWIR